MSWLCLKREEGVLSAGPRAEAASVASGVSALGREELPQGGTNCAKKGFSEIKKKTMTI